MTLLQANVQNDNTRYDDFLALVKSEQPDLIILQEVNWHWLRRLNALNNDWPYHIIPDSSQYFGSAIWSRFPLETLAIQDFAQNGRDSIAFAMQVAPDKTLYAITTHPVPPLGFKNFPKWQQQLTAVSQWPRQLGIQVHLLVGDLNSTPWSKQYQQLLENNGLHTARQGFGVLVTWPWPLLPLLLPLDHCLVNDDVFVYSIRQGRPFGSDHLPLITKFSF